MAESVRDTSCEGREVLGNGAGVEVEVVGGSSALRKVEVCVVKDELTRFVGLVFDPKGVEVLRDTQHLVGALIGSVPDHGSQNAVHSLPLYLMPEEVHLGVKKGVIDLNCADSDLVVDGKLRDYPTTDKEKRRQKVFDDLHSKGFYITSGMKFGGDFLVYPGDPMRYHAHYIVIVLEWNQTFHGLDLIAFARLGVGVKKCAVLAAPNLVDDTVSYITLDWQGTT